MPRTHASNNPGTHPPLRCGAAFCGRTGRRSPAPAQTPHTHGQQLCGAMGVVRRQPWHRSAALPLASRSDAACSVPSSPLQACAAINPPAPSETCAPGEPLSSRNPACAPTLMLWMHASWQLCIHLTSPSIAVQPPPHMPPPQSHRQGCAATAGPGRAACRSRCAGSPANPTPR